MRSSIFIFFVCVANLLFARAKDEIYFAHKPEHLEIQKAICELRLQFAKEQLAKLKISDKKNATIDFLQLYTSYYKVLVHLDEKYLVAFNVAYENFLKVNQLLPNSSPQKNYSKGSALLMKAIVSGAFNKYIEAASGFRSAYLVLSENQKKFPTFLSNLKELGALEAMIGSMPSQYHWIISALGLKGTIAGGISKIELYLSKSRFEPMIEQQQASIYLTLIQFNFADKQKAWTFYKDYAQNIETNLMQAYVTAFVAGKSGHNKEALAALENRPKSQDYEQLPYLNFLKGEFLLHQLNFDASIWYKKYIYTSESKGSIKEAYQKLSWISLVQNDTEKYLLYKSMSEKLQAHLGSEQKLVNADLHQKIYLNKNLLKARFLFDGGYFEQALHELKQVDVKNLTSNYQKTEYYYRLARVYHEMNNIAESLKMYKECLVVGETINTYFKPNACLQLGLIYKQMGYVNLAKDYFNEVSAFKDYDYEDSIKQKAKAGLNQIE